MFYSRKYEILYKKKKYRWEEVKALVHKKKTRKLENFLNTYSKFRKFTKLASESINNVLEYIFNLIRVYIKIRDFNFWSHF